MAFFSLFQRKTSGGEYLAFVDGIRFLAVFLVVTFHLHGILVSRFDLFHSEVASTFIEPIFKYGYKGVDVFFVLSGFVIAHNYLTFKEKYRKSQPVFDFYKRRFYRIYPPFAISVLLLFIGNVWIVPQFSFSELFPSLVATLTYSKNILQHFYTLPNLNSVTWTLEIEIQFYLLFPVLFALLFEVYQKWQKQLIFILIVIFVFLNQILDFKIVTLFDYLPLFLSGMLFAAFYVQKISFPIHPILGLFLAMVVLGLILFTSRNTFSPQLQAYLYPFLFLIFFMLASQKGILNKLLSQSIICLVGGMCYSIYLLHCTVISMLDRFVKKSVFFGNQGVDGIMWLILNLVLIVSVCALYYVFVEKPFMKRKV